MDNSSVPVQQSRWLSPSSCDHCEGNDLVCDKGLPFCGECVTNNISCKYGAYAAPPAPVRTDSPSEAWLAPNPCDPCCDKQVPCDKGLPLCTQCAASGLDCEYSTPRRPMQSKPTMRSNSTPPPQSHLEKPSQGHIDSPLPANSDTGQHPLLSPTVKQLGNKDGNRSSSQTASPSTVAHGTPFPSNISYPNQGTNIIDTPMRDHGKMANNPSQHDPRNDSPQLSPKPNLVDYTGPDSRCLDCKVLYPNHASFCNISKCKPRKLTELTIAQLGRIADAVEHNDPEQWREHQAPPATPEPEDYGTKVKEMAEIVRNEDTYKNDPVLHGLDDSALLILWALRTSSKIKADIIWLDGDTPYYLESASDDDGENKGDNGDSQTSTKNTND